MAAATAADPSARAGAGERTPLVDLMSVDVHALSALHAQIPPGPYQAMRSGDGVTTRHEVRALDTRPDDKHHWPYRLLESIQGQSAGCDDAVFDFVTGVVNAWPLIAELCEDGVIARTLKASGDEVRDVVRAEGEDPDEAVATLDRMAAQAFASHAAVAFEGVVGGRCLDITGEITLDRGGVEVRTLLSDDDRRFAAAAWNASASRSPEAGGVAAEGASPAKTKAALADATFDLAAPTHRVEAGAVAGDLGGVDAALDRMLLTTWDERAGICSAGSTKAAREAVLDAVRALVTPAGDAAKLVDAYRDAVLDAAEADRCYYPDQASEDRCRQADRAEAAARAALDAHLAAKDRELVALRRSGAAGDGVREAVPAQLRRLSEAATPGPWSVSGVRSRVDEPSCVRIDAESCRGLMALPTGFKAEKALHAMTDAKLACAAVNYLRSRISAEDRARGAQVREADRG